MHKFNPEILKFGPTPQNKPHPTYLSTFIVEHGRVLRAHVYVGRTGGPPELLADGMGALCFNDRFIHQRKGRP